MLGQFRLIGGPDHRHSSEINKTIVFLVERTSPIVSDVLAHIRRRLLFRGNFLKPGALGLQPIRNVRAELVDQLLETSALGNRECSGQQPANTETSCRRRFPCRHATRATAPSLNCHLPAFKPLLSMTLATSKPMQQRTNIQWLAFAPHCYAGDRADGHLIHRRYAVAPNTVP